MRIAYFVAGGAMGFLPLRDLAEQHEVVVVVRPGSQRAFARRWLASFALKLRRRTIDPVSQFTRHRHIPSLTARSGNDPLIASRLEALRPDLICISTFPWLLSPTIFTLPPCGAINLHSSLLPRHRGPTPLFWIYYHDDRQTGVTVHSVNEQADAGGILCQEAFPLPRGFNIACLHDKKARRGAKLLRQAVEAIGAGRAQPEPQDATLATPAPRVRRNRKMVDFAAWDVERVWHFLAGLYPQFLEPLSDHKGRAICYGKVIGYVTRDHHRSPGSLERAPYGWDLYCIGGFVKLESPPSALRSGATACLTS